MNFQRHDLWDSWSGAGDHQGHTVTAIEEWPVRVDINAATRTSVVDTGRVRCSCGVEWNTIVGGISYAP